MTTIARRYATNATALVTCWFAVTIFAKGKVTAFTATARLFAHFAKGAEKHD